MTPTTAKERVATFAVLAAMALVVLDAGVINVALPLLAARLGTYASDTILVVGAYQAALVAGLLPCAHLAERTGYRRLFATGIAIFVTGALVSSLSPSLPVLVVARSFQGLGGAAVMALGIALLRAALGTARLNQAISWNALTVALCSAAAPTIGALICSFAPLPLIFTVGLPIGAAALLASRALPSVAPTRQRANVAGILLYGLAVALLFLAARLAAGDLASGAGLACAALICILLLLRREHGTAAPLIPFDLLAGRPFRASVTASVCCFTGQSIGLVALPFLLQTGLGHGPLAAGLIITSWPLAVALTSPIARRIEGALTTSAQCAAGAAVLAAGLLLPVVVSAQDSIIPLVGGGLLCGSGFGLFQLANNRVMFSAAPIERSAAAGGVQGTARLTGQTGGTMLMALIFSSVPSFTIAPRIGLALGAIFAMAAALVSLRGAARSTGCVRTGPSAGSGQD